MACEINVSGVFFPSRAKEAKKQKNKNKNKITPDLRLTLGRKFDITHWFSCGAEGNGVWSCGYQNFPGG